MNFRQMKQLLLLVHLNKPYGTIITIFLGKMTEWNELAEKEQLKLLFLKLEGKMQILLRSFTLLCWHF